MKDQFGREISYLRISVTQRCNFHCAYCGAEQPEPDLLSAQDFGSFAAAFAKVGITKFRLTGGEPLVRSDVDRIAALIKQNAAPETLAITTNGFLLEEKARELKAAGVNAVNISLDTLDEACFQTLTGTNALNAVLRGLETALATGFDKVKINAVLLRGVNDAGAARLIELARRHPLDVRFIELMPRGSGEEDTLRVTSAELLGRFPYLEKVSENGTAAEYTAPGFRGKIGLISPVSKKFCKNCSRIRLLHDGRLKPCLGREETYDLRPYLNDEAALIRQIQDVIIKKPAGHRFEDPAGGLKPMNLIGG